MVTNNVVNEPTAASGTVLQGQGIGTASNFSTATYPATTTVSQILYSSSTNTVGGLATANNGVLITSNTGVPSVLAESATAGIPLVSGGTGVPPAFTTAVVAGGGTGAASYSINGPVISSTTSTGALSAITLGLQQFLVGNTSAAPTAKSLSVVNQVFTSTGTYTPTAGMVYCIIQAIGGGGGGAGAQATTGAQVSVGCGGGGGEYAQGIFSAATIGASKTVTIGAAGAAGTGGNGGTGGTTSVGSTNISAIGGQGGTTGTAGATSQQAGGVGGTGGTGGDFRSPGIAGMNGFANLTPGFILAGSGGSSVFGAGGLGSTTTAAAGNPGLGYGGGGGGAVNYSSQSAINGGAGTKGVVVVTEYVIS
jgi:hypothetical protein